jgi:hypothetical protein
MAEAEGEEGAPSPAPAPCMAPAPEPAYVPTGPFDVTSLSVAQIQECFRASSTEERLKLLARCLAIEEEEVEEDLRKQIWLELLVKVLQFCKDEYLSPTRTHAFVGVIAALHAHAVESKCSKLEGFDFFKDALLSATKALPLAERFSLSEAQALTGYARSSYLDAIRLHQLVYIEEQSLRQSQAELFLQTPAEPPPLAKGVDPATMPPPEPDAPAAAAPAVDASDPAEPAAAPAADADAAAEPEAAAPSNDALTEAIAATINSQVEAHQQQLAAEFAAKEQTLLNRIGVLESKVN